MRNDKIDEAMLIENVLEWAAVDKIGHIACFESAGLNIIHPAVLKSNSLRLEVIANLKRLPSHSSWTGDYQRFLKLNRVFPDQTNEEAYRVGAEYCAKTFASKGVFSYDLVSPDHTHVTFIRYIDVHLPVRIDALPSNIRDKLKDVRIDVDFRNTTEFTPKKFIV